MKTYPEALHAMQTGVKIELQTKGMQQSGCSPEQLRVGNNSAAISHAALAQLLIEKGLFTLDEYMAALTKAANDEVERYESILSAETGKLIKLH
jgi:hypothetical protein